MIKMTNLVLGEPFDGAGVVVVVSGDDVSNSKVALVTHVALMRAIGVVLTIEKQRLLTDVFQCEMPADL